MEKKTVSKEEMGNTFGTIRGKGIRVRIEGK